MRKCQCMRWDGDLSPGKRLPHGGATSTGLRVRTDPRSICLAEKCVQSTCGDGFIDVEAGEQCEDGNRENNDGCSSDCRVEAGGGGDPTNYTGCYALQPPVLHTCTSLLSGAIAVRIQATRLDFNRLVNELMVRRGLPIPGAVPAPADMTQRPAPDDGNFDVRGVNEGLCNEEYRLTGRFTNAERTRWTATLQITFTDQANGFFCGLTNCNGPLPPLNLRAML